MWGFVIILKEHDIPVYMLKEERIGYVVYEDDFQVAAQPFAETMC